MKKHKLIEIDWPEFGTCPRPEAATTEEYTKRAEALRVKMENKGLTHLVVYGDREHFANMAYLTGFDPRFEEALLIMNLKQKPVLLVGNECEARLPASPLYLDRLMDGLRYQPFSLLDQPKTSSPFLQDIFVDYGIGEQSSIGCIGWKYFSEIEHPNSKYAIEIPSFIVDTLRDLAGKERVVNATELLMAPDSGMRTFITPSEIAYFEFTNILASEGMKNMLFHMEDGMIDYDLALHANYNGEPQGCHMTLGTGGNQHISMAGPMGTTVRRGDPFSTNISYWGSNICRAGWVASSKEELPQKAKGYVEDFAGIYFEAMNEWFSMLKIGTKGGKIANMMANRLPFNKFGIFLNPGHLIHLDEWLSSPFYKGSEIRIHSGMVIQTDIIPSSPEYFSTRMEDGIVIADKSLRTELKGQFPDCYNRCLERRLFMENELGIELPEEILPLSNIPAIVPPFVLKPNLVFTMEK